jgi:hypothetical protein
MPWFKVDDSAHAHPKMRKAGKAAIGLWVLCGSYASAYLTNGIVPAETAAEGTEPQIAKLVRVGLWHASGHDCDRCAQPTPGDYIIHDYLIYNPSRARVLADRRKAADKKRNQRAGDGPGSDTANGNAEVFGEDSAPKTTGIGEENAPKKSRIQDEEAGQSDPSPGDSNRPHARAARPDPVVAYNEGTTAGLAERTGGVPDRLRPLAKALSAAGLGAVAWDIRKHTDWERIRIQVDRLGVDLMVESALAAAEHRGKPDSVTAWIGRWESLEDPQPSPGSLPDTAGPNVISITGQRLSGPDANLAGHAALIAQLQAREGNQ